MHKIFIICLLSSFISCQYSNRVTTTNTLEDVVKSKGSSIVLISISDNVQINWDNKSNGFVEDSLLDIAMKVAKTDRQLILDEVLNRDESEARICGLNGNLAVGDLAFLLISKTYDLPYFQVFEIQWDTFDAGCAYPSGMLEYIQNHRSEMKEKMEMYFSN